MSATSARENFASPGGAALDKPHVYAAPARLKLNRLGPRRRLDGRRTRRSR